MNLRIASRLLAPGLLLCLVPTLTLCFSEEGSAQELTPAEAREQIEAMYDDWGQARVALDRPAMERILAPGFRAVLYDREISRDEFLSAISGPRRGGRMTRFDASVLTLRRSDEGWTAVITERIEVEGVPGEGGEPGTLCSLWVTRDDCRKEGEQWVVTCSEAIGNEAWAPGTRPPLRDW
jgi:hypothetical protein